MRTSHKSRSGPDSGSGRNELEPNKMTYEARSAEHVVNCARPKGGYSKAKK